MMKLESVGETEFQRLFEVLERDEVVRVSFADRLNKARALLSTIEPVLRSNIDLGEDAPATMFPSRLSIAPHLERRVVQWSADATRSPNTPNDRALIEVGTEVCAFLTSWAGRLMTEFTTRYSQPYNAAKGLQRQDAWVLNAIHYPALPDHQDEPRFPTHRDWGLFACYPAIKGKGLELFLDGAWQPITLGSGEMLVYAGMAATLFTKRLLGNRLLRAASHRVMQRSMRGRSALIYYIDPPRDVALPDGRPFGQFLFEQRQKIGQF